MARSRWIQVELKEMAGSEWWVLVRHSGRQFKLPGDAPISEMLRGCAEGWSAARARRYVKAAIQEQYRPWRVIGEGPTARSIRS